MVNESVQIENLLKTKPYELSIWEDWEEIQENNITSFQNKEHKVCVFGGSDMDTLGRAQNVTLVSKVTGDHTLTFTMFSKYASYGEYIYIAPNVEPQLTKGEIINNPFLQYLKTEGKIKLRIDNYPNIAIFDNDKDDYQEGDLVSKNFDSNSQKIKTCIYKYENGNWIYLDDKYEWHVMIIKKIEQDTSNGQYKYTATDLFINELARNGYNLEFKTEANNNIGTAEELVERVLDGSEWSLDKENSENVHQYQLEPGLLFKCAKIPNLSYQYNNYQDNYMTALDLDTYEIIKVKPSDGVFIYYSTLINASKADSEQDRFVQAYLLPNAYKFYGYDNGAYVYTERSENFKDYINENDFTLINGKNIAFIYANWERTIGNKIKTDFYWLGRGRKSNNEYDFTYYNWLNNNSTGTPGYPDSFGSQEEYSLNETGNCFIKDEQDVDFYYRANKIVRVQLTEYNETIKQTVKLALPTNFASGDSLTDFNYTENIASSIVPSEDYYETRTFEWDYDKIGNEPAVAGGYTAQYLRWDNIWMPLTERAIKSFRYKEIIHIRFVPKNASYSITFSSNSGNHIEYRTIFEDGKRIEYIDLELSNNEQFKVYSSYKGVNLIIHYNNDERWLLTDSIKFYDKNGVLLPFETNNQLNYYISKDIDRSDYIWLSLPFGSYNSIIVENTPYGNNTQFIAYNLENIGDNDDKIRITSNYNYDDIDDSEINTKFNINFENILGTEKLIFSTELLYSRIFQLHLEPHENIEFDYRIERKINNVLKINTGTLNQIVDFYCIGQEQLSLEFTNKVSDEEFDFDNKTGQENYDYVSSLDFYNSQSGEIYKYYETIEVPGGRKISIDLKTTNYNNKGHIHIKGNIEQSFKEFKIEKLNFINSSDKSLLTIIPSYINSNTDDIYIQIDDEHETNLQIITSGNYLPKFINNGIVEVYSEQNIINNNNGYSINLEKFLIDQSNQVSIIKPFEITFNGDFILNYNDGNYTNLIDRLSLNPVQAFYEENNNLLKLWYFEENIINCEFKTDRNTEIDITKSGEEIQFSKVENEDYNLYSFSLSNIEDNNNYNIYNTKDILIIFGNNFDKSILEGKVNLSTSGEEDYNWISNNTIQISVQKFKNLIIEFDEIDLDYYVGYSDNKQKETMISFETYHTITDINLNLELFKKKKLIIESNNYIDYSHSSLNASGINYEIETKENNKTILRFLLLPDGYPVRIEAGINSSRDQGLNGVYEIKKVLTNSIQGLQINNLIEIQYYNGDNSSIPTKISMEFNSLNINNETILIFSDVKHTLKPFNLTFQNYNGDIKNKYYFGNNWSINNNGEVSSAKYGDYEQSTLTLNLKEMDFTQGKFVINSELHRQVWPWMEEETTITMADNTSVTIYNKQDSTFQLNNITDTYTLTFTRPGSQNKGWFKILSFKLYCYKINDNSNSNSSFETALFGFDSTYGEDVSLEVLNSAPLQNQINVNKPNPAEAIRYYTTTEYNHPELAINLLGKQDLFGGESKNTAKQPTISENGNKNYDNSIYMNSNQNDDLEGSSDTIDLIDSYFERIGGWINAGYKIVKKVVQVGVELYETYISIENQTTPNLRLTTTQNNEYQEQAKEQIESLQGQFDFQLDKIEDINNKFTFGNLLKLDLQLDSNQTNPTSFSQVLQAYKDFYAVKPCELQIKKITDKYGDIDDGIEVGSRITLTELRLLIDKESVEDESAFITNLKNDLGTSEKIQAGINRLQDFFREAYQTWGNLFGIKVNNNDGKLTLVGTLHELENNTELANFNEVYGIKDETGKIIGYDFERIKLNYDFRLKMPTLLITNTVLKSIAMNICGFVKKEITEDAPIYTGTGAVETTFKQIVPDNISEQEQAELTQEQSLIVYHYYTLENGKINYLYEGYTRQPQWEVPFYDPDFQKIASIDIDKSNRFNIITQICENFQCWVNFDIYHYDNGEMFEENGKPIKKVRIISEPRPSFGLREALQNFKYGENLNYIKRTIDSNQLSTYIIVEPNNNTAAVDGFCSITRAVDNYSKENAILNLDYFAQTGLIPREEVYKDIYDIPNKNSYIQDIINSDQIYYNYCMRLLNSDYDNYTKKIIEIETQAYHIDADMEVSKKALQSSEDQIKKIAEFYNDKFGTAFNLDYNNIISESKQFLNAVKKAVEESGQTNLTVSEELDKIYSGDTSSIYTDIATSIWKKVKDVASSLRSYLNNDSYINQALTNFDKIVKICTNLNPFRINADGETINTSSSQTLKGSIGGKLGKEEPTAILLEEIQFWIEAYTKYLAEYEIYLKQWQEVDQQYNNLITALSTISANKKIVYDKLFKKYSRFIQEGTWQSSEYIDDDQYYIDALSVAFTSSRPQVTYDISVLDLSGIDPDKYSFKVGQKSYVEDDSFFGIGKKEPVIISEISYNFDDPTQIRLTVKNYQTRFEDLFQRISASVQSLQFVQDVYQLPIGIKGNIDPTDRTSNPTLDETINDQKTLSPEGGAQEVRTTADGIIVVSKNNPNNITKIVSGGVYTSTDGGATYVNAISNGGINASALNTGIINTQQITITNGGQTAFRWDRKGLTAYKSQDYEISGIKKAIYDPTSFVRFDQYGLYGVINKNNWEPSDISDIEENCNFGILWSGFFYNGEMGGVKTKIDNTGINISKNNTKLFETTTNGINITVNNLITNGSATLDDLNVTNITLKNASGIVKTQTLQDIGGHNLIRYEYNGDSSHYTYVGNNDSHLRLTLRDTRTDQGIDCILVFSDDSGTVARRDKTAIKAWLGI